MLTLEDLLQSRHHRRLVFSLAFLATVLLVALKHVALPWFGHGTTPNLAGVLEGVLDDLLEAVVAGAAVAAVVLWLTPSSLRKQVISPVHPANLKDTLRGGLEDTTEFWYVGHTGQWTVAVTLPALAQQAREEGLAKSVSLVLLDLRDEALCARYALYRNGLRTAAVNPEWSCRSVQLQLLGTLLSVQCWKQRESLLKFQVALSPAFSVFRYDISSRLAVVTTEDPRVPALACESGSTYYKSLRQDAILQLEQSELIADLLPACTFASLAPAHIENLWNALNLGHNPLSATECVEIAERVRSPRNPYPG